MTKILLTEKKDITYQIWQQYAKEKYGGQDCMRWLTALDIRKLTVKELTK